jgi:[ribosomal protein S5]-alanine N-acetyltransferase
VTHVLDTERLALRQFDLDDAPFVLRLLNEPAFLQHIGDRGVRTLDDARRYLREGPLASYARHGFGLWCVMTREVPARPIGMCGLLRRDGLPDADIGYAFLEESWSRGYASEAVQAVLAHARDRLGLLRVLAIVSPGNERSVRVLRKFGFADSGRVQLSPSAPEVLLFSTGPEPTDHSA